MADEISPLVPAVEKIIKPWLDHTMVVALSGGKDSSVLLSIMCQLRDKGLIKSLSALHIHHGLCKDADQWALHCESVCAECDVAIQVVPVNIKEPSKNSPEEAARIARYQVFEETIQNKCCLLQAHHSHDVAETVLYRMCRGTGLPGLTGIPAYRALGEGVLVRPLLWCMQEVINDYAQVYKVHFVQDYSNYNQKFDRNYIRYSVMPVLEKRWPKTVKHFLALVQDVLDVNREMTLLVAQRLSEVVVYREFWSFESIPLIDINQLKCLSDFMKRNVLREWLIQRGVNVPDRKLLQQIISELIHAKTDGEPLIKWSDFEIRRFREVLLVAPKVKTIDMPKVLQWDWRNEPVLLLPDGSRLIIDNSFKVSKQCVVEQSVVSFLLPKGSISVRFRESIASDLKFSVVNREGRKTLKRWLQIYDIPPWMRNKLPILFFEDDMIGVPGVWCCTEYYSQQGVRIIRQGITSL